MNGYAHPEALVDAPWVQRHLGAPMLRLVDVRYSLAGPQPDGYAAGHLPGAVFCNLHDDTSDLEGDVPCRVAAAPRFQAAMRRLGIGPSTHVVVYDQDFGGWAARLWWALRYYGHERVSLVDGGVAAWVASGFPLDSGAASAAPAHFSAVTRPTLRASVDEVLAADGRHDVVIVDALPRRIYRGEVPMFPTHRPGHIPWARNVPARFNTDRETGLLLPPDRLAAVWEHLGLRPEQRVITYCGAGDYGSFDLFALHLLGHDNAALYDGSWLEWGARADLPVAIGDDPPH